MTDEKLVSELEVILSEYQLLDIRLGNAIEGMRQKQNDALEGKKITEGTKKINPTQRQGEGKRKGAGCSCTPSVNPPAILFCGGNENGE